MILLDLIPARLYLVLFTLEIEKLPIRHAYRWYCTFFDGIHIVLLSKKYFKHSTNSFMALQSELKSVDVNTSSSEFSRNYFRKQNETGMKPFVWLNVDGKLLREQWTHS